VRIISQIAVYRLVDVPRNLFVHCGFGRTRRRTKNPGGKSTGLAKCSVSACPGAVRRFSFLGRGLCVLGGESKTGMGVDKVFRWWVDRRWRGSVTVSDGALRLLAQMHNHAEKTKHNVITVGIGGKSCPLQECHSLGYHNQVIHPLNAHFSLMPAPKPTLLYPDLTARNYPA
jgi:hypothetical protein